MGHGLEPCTECVTVCFASGAQNRAKTSDRRLQHALALPNTGLWTNNETAPVHIIGMRTAASGANRVTRVLLAGNRQPNILIGVKSYGERVWGRSVAELRVEFVRKCS